ncbi:Isopentenyldiphosphate isomerase [Novosphingobium sp. CF614]|uniref:NUDIX hydrolase n=1 Tax=Novosphingobium sp. CF614 TaxID=1884364 RepID=UPI0008F02D3B|nr:NUDIX domain-containing protein [Novosphingobium sp. CF614]SFG02055.1 Isopentenyldiphosphate isomerase [Novosphingobium sp. CF614]
MEHIDIYDANMRRLGSMERMAAHRAGHWHQTVHFWLVDREQGGRLFFQLRGPAVRANPDRLDATAAGHMLAGETLSAGWREVREELGIDIPPIVHELGFRTEVSDMPDGDVNREFQAIYLAEAPSGPEGFAPDPAEVHGVLAIGISDLHNLIANRIEAVTASGIIFAQGDATWRPERRRVTMDALVPRFRNYYASVAIMAERLVEGRWPLAIG